MKSNLFYFLALAVVMTTQSCEDFLDKKPSSQGVAVSNTASDALLYKTASDAETALAGVYADFKNEYFMLDYYVNGDAQSDDAYAGADNPANFQIDKYSIDATNSNISRDWTDLYSTIGKANLVINNTNAVPAPTLNYNLKQPIC